MLASTLTLITMQATTYLKNALDNGEKCVGFWLT